MAANQHQADKKGRRVEKQEEVITIDFRAKPKEKAMIQDCVNRMYNQFLDPNTKEPKNGS